MALPAYALVTLDQAKARLGVTDDDRDSTLESLIGEVSRTVMQATGREYAPATAATRTVSVQDGSSVIDLYPYEARSVTAITLNAGATDEYAVPAGDWQLAPVTSPDGVYDRIVLASGLSVASKFGEVPVSVVGTWGWASVPADVQGWVLELVEDRWKQDVAFYADADGFIADSPAGGGNNSPVTIPFRIRDQMESVKRVRIGSV